MDQYPPPANGYSTGASGPSAYTYGHTIGQGMCINLRGLRPDRFLETCQVYSRR